MYLGTLSKFFGLVGEVIVSEKLIKKIEVVEDFFFGKNDMTNIEMEKELKTLLDKEFSKLFIYLEE